ncbi:MAG: DUF2254 domain-containing protein [Burkholderiales bacterium]|nr:DUF2254 domain-containing protein [Burkholderiales bacterium]
MGPRLAYIWGQLRASYWFVPGLLSIGAAALAAALIWTDAAGPARGAAGLQRFDLTGPEGARALLSTIAGSAITVAGLVFSITMVVLNTASSQFGPRLMRNFMQHNGTQVVMGLFVGTFVYCLLALAAVRSEAGAAFVPQTAVAGGVVLGITAFALLIYFIHHVSRFVQAAHVIDDVAGNLEESVCASFPERAPGARRAAPDDELEAGRAPGKAQRDELAIEAPRSGYVQAIDVAGLVEVARERDLLIRLAHRPGQFLIAGRPLAWVSPATAVDAALAARVAGALVTGRERTSTQDPEFAVHQLVEVALRALSPGINDPYTALNCIDRLASALALLAKRALPSRYSRDASGRVRLVCVPLTYGGMVDAAFDQIRQAARGTPAVLFRLLEAIASIADGDLPEPLRAALQRQVEALHEASGGGFAVHSDQAEYCTRLRTALGALLAAGAVRPPEVDR